MLLASNSIILWSIEIVRTSKTTVHVVSVQIESMRFILLWCWGEKYYVYGHQDGTTINARSLYRKNKLLKIRLSEKSFKNTEDCDRT